MSGGSFEYLYTEMDTPEQLYGTLSRLVRMKEYCEGYLSDAVPYIEDMVQLINRFDQEYCEKGAKIKDLLQAIEWEASSDGRVEDVYEEIKKLKDADQSP